MPEGEVVTWTTVFLLALFALVALVTASLLLPEADPDPHPYVTDPAETEHEHVGRRRHPDDNDGPTRRLASADQPIHPPNLN